MCRLSVNIVDVLSSYNASVDDKMKYFKSSQIFSNNEINLIYGAFNGDESVTTTEDFKKLIVSKEAKILEINRKYNVQVLLNNLDLLTTTLTKDLVICQSIMEYFYSNNMQPTAKEWTQIESKISNKSIFNHIKNYKKPSLLDKKEDLNQKAIAKSIEEVKSKYIDKYKGKIIYIDFYATWCAPCRAEIPYSKQLHKKFKNKDVVFLNLCASSKKEDWENLIKQYNLGGENYFLTNEEFNLLSKMYKVKGFPTYIIIGKNGDVLDYKALRPSDKNRLYKKIDELLK